MTINIKGEPLWKKNPNRKYKCGCAMIQGESMCPVHKEPLQEHMIYGNETTGSLNEKERYEKENLNE